MRKKLAANLVESELGTIQLVFSEEVKPQELYLFGSASEGKMTDHSDYDLLVVMKDVLDCKKGMKAYRRIRSLLPRRPIDVVWMHRTEFDLKKEEGGIAFIAFSEGRKLI